MIYPGTIRNRTQSKHIFHGNRKRAFRAAHATAHTALHMLLQRLLTVLNVMNVFYKSQAQFQKHRGRVCTVPVFSFLTYIDRVFIPIRKLFSSRKRQLRP